VFFRALLVVWLVVGVSTCWCFAGQTEEPAGAEPEEPCDTLTDGWFGAAEKLEDAGITIDLGLTQIWQQNVKGGLSTKHRNSRYSGSYDLEVTFGLEKIVGWKDAILFAHGEGSWSDGIDGRSVGSIFGVNADAGGARSIDLTELYLEQALFEGKLIIRIGKLDLTGGFECRGCPVAFDGNAFANDESTQFLNGALVNNPTIPFPEKGLGAVVYYQPLEWWYVGAGVGDAQADPRETGFRTAFRGDSHAFGIFETGVAPQITSARGPLQGTYRIGCWYNGQPMDRLDGNGTKRSNVGFYVSADQMFCKENDAEDDSQGLGAFCRWGVGDADVSEAKSFWSTGVQYQGLIPSRDDDVLAFGVAQGRLSRAGGYNGSHETVMEMYYNAQVLPWLNITPSVQYVINPGGDSSVNHAVVIGVRVQMTF